VLLLDDELLGNDPLAEVIEEERDDDEDDAFDDVPTLLERELKPVAIAFDIPLISNVDEEVGVG
jgi:hypothetical protein